MVTRALWVLLAGILAYSLEYGLGLDESITKTIAYLVAVPTLILLALDASPFRLTGRLKGTKDADSIESASSKTDRPVDPLFKIGAILYGGAYLIFLFRVRPRELDRFRDMFLELTPVELFWLVAPILVLWWYRQRVVKRSSNAA